MKRELMLTGLVLAGAVAIAQPPGGQRREQIRERIAERRNPPVATPDSNSTPTATATAAPYPTTGPANLRAPVRMGRRIGGLRENETPGVSQSPAPEPKNGETKSPAVGATPAPSPAARTAATPAANATPFVPPPMNPRETRGERIQEMRNRLPERNAPVKTDASSPAASTTPAQFENRPTREPLRERIQERREAATTTAETLRSTPPPRFENRPNRDTIREQLQERREERMTSRPSVLMPHPKLTPYAQGLKDRPTPAPAPVSGTPTPTPVAERISRKDWQVKKGVIATPPPAPTPGVTPVPTPPDVTPTPTAFKPTRDWRPYPGWQPPGGWKPPQGWVPPGGWCAPAGWNCPAEWVPRMQNWGWSYIAGRGWVVDVRWVPPPDFVVPPGWYYMPEQSYHDYGFYYPGQVVVAPGVARPDLIVNINIGQAYRPAQPPPVIIAQAPPPRALPSTRPQEVSVASVSDVQQALTRPRQPDAPRYDGPVLVTGAIHFDSGSYDIKPESFETLNRIGEALLAPPLDQSIINVEGHTDSDGSDEYNQKLSENRAWSVKSYLVQRFGIDPNRLIIVGYGESAPIADNNTDEGKAQNRRVEFENVTDLYNSQVVDTSAEGAKSNQ